jgi:hypothetical protein
MGPFEVSKKDARSKEQRDQIESVWDKTQDYWQRELLKG